MTLHQKPSPIDRLIRFSLENKLVVVLSTAALIFWGLMVAPFDWDFEYLPRDPVPVDAIPDIGENQQIVFTEWMGRSPQDIEDQITYPLTTALLGLPEVKTVRSYSMFGFSSIYIIFKEDAEFYWTRSRILEKLGSLSSGTLPPGVQPRLGPDATALGQVYHEVRYGQPRCVAAHPLNYVYARLHGCAQVFGALYFVGLKEIVRAYLDSEKAVAQLDLIFDAIINAT